MEKKPPKKRSPRRIIIRIIKDAGLEVAPEETEIGATTLTVTEGPIHIVPRPGNP